MSTAVAHLSAAGSRQLHDTPTHAAAAALTVAAALADPVRTQSARALYPLIAAAADGDGAPARTRCSPLCALVADALAATDRSDPRAELVLALERWLLHPTQRTAKELTEAAREVTEGSRPPLDVDTLDKAWLAGSGIEQALAAVRRGGFTDAGAHLSVIAAATAAVVPMVWVARELNVARAVVYRLLRNVDPHRWRELLP